MKDSSTQITLALYRIEGQNQNAQVLIKDSTIWATQKIIAELFGVDKSTISRHIANIYAEGELPQDSTIAKIATPQKEDNDNTRDNKLKIQILNKALIRHCEKIRRIFVAI